MFGKIALFAKALVVELAYGALAMYEIGSAIVLKNVQ